MTKNNAQRIYSEDGTEFAILSGATHRCKIEGCKGDRVSALWSDGKRTFPCTEGTIIRQDGNLQIR